MSTKHFELSCGGRLFNFYKLFDNSFNVTLPMDGAMREIANRFNDEEFRQSVELMEQTANTILEDANVTFSFEFGELCVTYKGDAEAVKVAEAINESINDGRSLIF